MSRIIFLVCAIFLFACEKNFEIGMLGGRGVEFYVSQNSLSLNEAITAYNTIQLDTITVNNEPFISYNDILLYDSATYTFTVSFSKYGEAYRDMFKNSQNFVVALNKEPIMYGFFWSLLRSEICPCIYLIEPNEQFDADNANELKLHFGYPTSQYAMGDDPRNNPNLIARLKEDGKLKVY